MAFLKAKLSAILFWISLLLSVADAQTMLRGLGRALGIGFEEPVTLPETEPPIATLPETEAPVPSIIDIAQGATDFSILVAAVQLAGLEDILSTGGPFTVFAPNNDAFLEVITSVEDLAAVDPAIIAEILKYHVVPGVVLSSDITDGLLLTTVQGETIEFGIDGDVITVNEELIVLADIPAANGVAHVIAGVMFPQSVLAPETDAPVPENPVEPVPETLPEPAPTTPTIADLAVATPGFEIIVELLTLSGLVDSLAGEGPFTVFAPNDDAFKEVITDIDNLDTLDPEIVAEILLYHVVPGSFVSSDITDGLLLPTVQGETIEFGVVGDVLTVNEEIIVLPDIAAGNGVIHVINGVMFPQSVLEPADGARLL